LPPGLSAQSAPRGSRPWLRSSARGNVRPREVAMHTEQPSHPASTTARVVARRLERRARTAPPAQGFAGPGHTAVEVVRPSALAQSDPFVLLMDDRIDFAPGREIGGEHPHAGLET